MCETIYNLIDETTHNVTNGATDLNTAIDSLRGLVPVDSQLFLNDIKDATALNYFVKKFHKIDEFLY